MDASVMEADARCAAWLTAIGWALSALLAPAPLAAESSESGSDKLAANRPCAFLVLGASVYQTCEDGGIGEIDLGVSDFGGSASYGVRSALPSPDHRHVAYLRDHDVWVYGSDADERRRITWVGQPDEPPWAAVTVSIKAWSPDSRRVVYHVGSPEGEGCEKPAEPIQVREAPYGFHVYDLVLEEDRLLHVDRAQDRIVTDHLSWLPDGSFVIASSSTPDEAGFTLTPAAPIELGAQTRGGEPRSRHVVRVPEDGRSATWVASLPGPPGQPYSSRDGRWLAMSVAVPGDHGKGSNSQLWRMNLDSGEASAVTAVGGWAQWQRPKVSPSGKRFAYVCFERDGASITESLIVDGECLSACPTGVRMEFEWVSDDVVVVACGESLSVLNAGTGAEVSDRDAH